MKETEPLYFKEFRTHFDKKIESSINELAIMIKDNFATKDDISNFATKDDLANFATKDDISNFATKDDLANFATKDDLANFATKDDLANFATKDDLANFATKDDVKEILAHIGRYEVRAQNVEQILTHDHKPRIVALEKAILTA